MPSILRYMDYKMYIELMVKSKYIYYGHLMHLDTVNITWYSFSELVDCTQWQLPDLWFLAGNTRKLVQCAKLKAFGICHGQQADLSRYYHIYLHLCWRPRNTFTIQYIWNRRHAEQIFRAKYFYLFFTFQSFQINIQC